MKYVYLLVEGQTEETFVRDILAPHLNSFLLEPVAIVLTTAQSASGKMEKGGTLTYTKIRKELLSLLHNPTASCVTTMFDFYQLRKDFPGFDNLQADWSGRRKVEYLEQQFKANIDNSKFLPYLSLHEFEALLFSATEIIAKWFNNQRQELQKIRSDYDTPEEINELNPPSKRLKTLFLKYDKVNDGILIAVETGLEVIRKECSHFNQWLTQLEKLGEAKDSQ